MKLFARLQPEVPDPRFFLSTVPAKGVVEIPSGKGNPLSPKDGGEVMVEKNGVTTAGKCEEDMINPIQEGLLFHER